LCREAIQKKNERRKKGLLGDFVKKTQKNWKKSSTAICTAACHLRNLKQGIWSPKKGLSKITQEPKKEVKDQQPRHVKKKFPTREKGQTRRKGVIKP